MNKDQYFDSILNSERMVANYDEAHEMLQENDNYDFDVFVRLAYEFSNRCTTPEHYARARWFVSALALGVLEFNFSESPNEHAYALYDAELPSLDHLDKRVSVGGM